MAKPFSLKPWIFYPRKNFVYVLIGTKLITVSALLHERKNKVEKHILNTCKKKGININEMRAGSRRRAVTEIRSHIARSLVKDYGIPLAEIGRQVGVSASAVSKMLKNGQE